MKIISTCLFLLLSGLAFSQFSRTFLHATPTRSTFSSYTFLDDQSQQHLVSLLPGTSTQLQLLDQKLSVQGDVTEVNHQNYTLAFPFGIINEYILGVAENQNERFYVLEVGGNTSLNIIWLKVNKTTGALISSYTSADTYRMGYFETKLIGNELVSYHVKSSGGLVRLAMNTASFTAPAEEMVDATITASLSFSNTINGYKSGNLLVVNGLEKIVYSGGLSFAKLFTRTAANTYSSVATGIATTRSVSSFLINPTTIGVTNGTAVEHYNASGTLGTSGTFSTNSILAINQVAFIDNGYHIFTKPNGTGSPSAFFKANASFAMTDSLKGIVPGIYQIFSLNGVNFILGNGLQKGVSEDLSGQASNGMTVFCETYSGKPTLNFSEYACNFDPGSHITSSIGLGTKVITSPNGLPGLNYDGLSGVYNLTERLVGFAGANDTISNALSTYNDQYDELPGPYTTNSMYDELMEAKYNRPYHVSLQMIQDHLDSLASGSSAYVPVWEISNWPANGNTALGQAANLAPFVDVNSNGIYEPLLGDYPSIYGSDCVFSITHYRDNGNTNKALEFHSYVYVQQCDTSEVFDNVLMRKVKVISRGAEIDSLFFGGIFDGDLGNYNDDYFGSHVELGMIYNYNGDSMDEDNSGRKGYHDTLAVQGIMVLKGFKQANDGLDNGIGIQAGQSVNGYGFNDGVTDNEYAGLNSSIIFTGTNAPVGQSDPANTLQLLNTLNGLWQLGDQMYYGGVGFPGAPCVTSIEANYMYPADSDPLHWGTEGTTPGFDWSEFEPCGSGSTSNPGGDRRGAYSFGKTALSNGESVELDYAYLIKRQNAPAATLFEPVTDLFVKAAAVRSAFLSNEGPCGINFDPISESLGIEESTITGDLFTVYPNPTTGLVRINGISEVGATVQVFDMNGKLLQTVTGYQAMQTIDLKELDGNLFILRIQSESKTEQKRVVKY
ncbi:T9SS type A sorting domain-containing protein [Fluviicola taffensis]|uniref:T9SS type A sorting domain-containing protein n=1 Tax=Fluviicola taffensis TaxID=191579 RepID=UPI0031378F5E